MVLDHHGETLVGGVETGAFGNGPGLERAVKLQAEIVVEMARVMALDAESEGMGGLGRGRGGSGLRGFLEGPFFAILG
jgi:hypothetical protein